MSCMGGSKEQNITIFEIFAFFIDNNNLFLLCIRFHFLLYIYTSSSYTLARTFQRIGQFAIAIVGLIPPQIFIMAPV